MANNLVIHLYAFSIFISIVLMAEQNGYYKNKAIFDTNQYHQQKQLQQKRGQQRNDVLSLAENLRFEMQQMQQQQEEEEEDGVNEDEEEREVEVEEQQMRKKHEQHIFDSFDLNNLRQLQEKQKCIHKLQQKQKQSNSEKEQKLYNNNNSNGYFNNYNELDQQQKQQKQHRQQLRQWQHPSQYKDNENGNSKNNNKYKPNNNNNNNNNHDNNETNEYKTGYSYYLFDNKSSSSNNNKNKHFNDVDNNNYNKVPNNKNNINDHNDYDDDDDVVDYRNGNPNNSDWATPSPTHQDASNDFRLQLSDRNEHVSYMNKSNSNNNNKYNDNNHKSNKESGDYFMYGNNDSHRNSRTGESNFHKSRTRKASAIPINNNNNENNNKSENNRLNQSDGDGTDTTNGHTIKIRDSQSYGKELDPNTDLADSEYQDYYHADEEAGIELPNDIQDVRKRAARKNSDVELRPTSISYQSLCPTKRIHIPLETVSYEYRPSHYVEVTCAHSYSLASSIDQSKNRICSEAGFICIQLNRTIHLIRRNKKATVECWESEIRIVPWGCECMWPKHSNGDIITYHDTQKRFNRNERPSLHTLKAAGYEKFPRQIQMINLDGMYREDNNEEIGYATYLID